MLKRSWLTLSMVFMLLLAMISPAAAQGIIMPRHNGTGGAANSAIQPKAKKDLYVSPYKHTLKKGKTKTLKAVNASGKSVSKVKWSSTNKKVATVSSSGKVKGVAQGTVFIIAKKSGYNDGVALITVKGSSKDPKILSTSDARFTYKGVLIKPSYSYSKTKGLLPAAYATSDDHDNYGLSFGSSNFNKAHTNIWYWGDDPAYINSFYATGKSPLKTNRGIAIGSKLSTVKKKYGQPTEIAEGKDGKTKVQFHIYVQDFKDYILQVTFCINKSTGKVLYMRNDYTWYDLYD